MKPLYFVVGVIVILLGGFAYAFSAGWLFAPEPPTAPISMGSIPAPIATTSSVAIKTIAENLTVPWDMVQLPDESWLVTERTGTLVRLQAGTVVEIPRTVAARGEGGLLGLTLHPNYTENNWLYLYETQSVSGGLQNRVVRYRFNEATNQLTNELVIIDAIPGAAYHDGGRIAFGPDGLLYVTTGDAGVTRLAQDRNSLAGKILRVADDGSVPANNPFNNLVYSYGHRNPQGLAWDSSGQLWSTEHGRSGVRSGLDELNRIEAGGNYGWPEIEGDETQPGMIPPVLHSGPSTTWAPASLAYADGKLYWGGLRGRALYEVTIQGDGVQNFTEYFTGEYGRIRSVVTGSDGIYFTTSNTDGRGSPSAGDDRFVFVPYQLLE